MPMRSALVHPLRAILALTVLLGVGSRSPSDAATPPAEPPFFPGGTYDPAIPTPASILGFEIGSRPARAAEVIRYFEAVAAATPRVVVTEYARTYEGRPLVYALVSSEENMAARDETRQAMERLADPRELGGGDEGRLVRETRAVIWLAYSIHGDELSSTDAAIQVLYQLAAGTDTLTARIRSEAIVAVDPLENPDGRERYLAMIGALRGAVPNADVQSLQHSGFWPYGRGNHYLFDLNRDWFYLVHPESRGRVAAVLTWNPIVLVDSHEMGALDTYLFSPPRAPFNPNLRPEHFAWWKTFAADQAKAFDRYGWPYYTRDWNEEWYPGYGSSWSLYAGLVGILYEQASTDGSPVKQRDGTVLTYRETVHHHVVSSLANCETTVRNRSALLQAFVDTKRRGIREGSGGATRAYLIDPSRAGVRADRFVRNMLLQNIEVFEATDSFQAGGLRDTWGRSGVSHTFPEGTIVVPMEQPMKALVQAIMEFDPALPDSFLTEERHYIEKFDESRLYETTAWSIPIAYGLDAYVSGGGLPGGLRQITEPPQPEPPAAPGHAAYGYMIDAADDASGITLARALDRGLVARTADKEVVIDGHVFARGSALFTNRSNPDALADRLNAIARETGATVRPITTALAERGPDLGGNDFRLLTEPRIGLIAGSGVDPNQYGALWRLLDDEYRIRVSSLDLASIAQIDLSKYNVLVFANTFGGAGTYRGVLREAGIGAVRDWVQAGGTFVGIGSGAVFAADSSVGLTSVRVRAQALEREIPQWPWEKRAAEAAAAGAKTGAKEDAKPSKDVKVLAEAERLGSRFSPHGVFLRVDLDPEHWLTAGYGEKVAAHMTSGAAFIAERPEQVVGRFAQAESLRVAGLLWPEARDRLARTAWLTRDPMGKGQVILFADSPVFRGAARGLERLVVNALIVGPGAGASRPTPW